MEELLSMGFSGDVASEALAATGGHSSLRAADWILNRNHDNPDIASAAVAAAGVGNSNQQTVIDRFFSSKPSPPPVKRLRSDPSSSPSPPTLSSPSPSPSQAIPPLSERMRPSTVAEIVGQDHILGPATLLRSALDSGAAALPSLVLWGPPGTGKTSLARALARSLPSHRFLPLSAVTSGVRDVRDAADSARRSRRPTILFVDEVHRFSKSQQDAFLPSVEDGTLLFIGATTENPSFHLTTPLLSRSRVLNLRPLTAVHVRTILSRAVEDSTHGLPLSFPTAPAISASPEAMEFLSSQCDGDARVALNSLENAATLAAARRHSPNAEVLITENDAREAMQCKHLNYHRAGDQHYDLISALHKSMRGSDADASLYWLARMLEGGEQPLYVARRLVRFASEDVGLADPTALNQAVACYQACHFIGMPECDVILAQCVVYLALAPKSVAVYKAFGFAKETVRSSVGGNEGVPLHLRNAPTKLMREMGYGKDYLYPPDHHDCSSQTYLPPSLQGRKFLNWPPHEENKQDI